eukprot:TRINITY_DN26603_c0_g1_i1.p1 TRINITY_DN26603_c0_g1~~TRINITY_DN26603_c0_g1_i1.p1  ORF type:complete len:302 (-),score=66.05 TRINITY_DN26603_c0_g1_i1:241-1146(-)
MANDYLKSRPKWGDAQEDDEYDGLPSPEVIEEKGPDGSILRTVIDYKLNDKGQKVKVTRKIKVSKTQIKISKKAEERRHWKKFGDCDGLPPGPERGITSIADEVQIEVTRREETEEQPKPEATTNLGIVCRNCKGEHWTLKCPYKDKLFAASLMPAAEGAAERGEALTSSSGGGAERLGGGEGKYVPPGARGGSMARAGEAMGRGGRDETATVRVTNLSEETKEADLQDLFRTFGPISRVYLAKDKVTGLSKGFAFINFMRRDDAARAIDKLSGKFGYDHLILHIEWARPSGNEPGAGKRI